MALRIHEQVVRGELDNRVKGRVTGRIWLAGWTEPLQLNLKGNARRDMAGCKLSFVNPAPQSGSFESLHRVQTGVCGDITAARKVKVPTVPVREWFKEHPKEPFPFRWGNAIYLEWFSDTNGRVVIESTDYSVELSTAEWHLTPEEEARQGSENARAMDRFMQQVTPGIEADSLSGESGNLDPDDDAEISNMVEQILRIEDLKQQVEKVAGSEPLTGGSDRVPLDVQEQFWKNVLAFESAPQTTANVTNAPNSATRNHIPASMPAGAPSATTRSGTPG
jgi:hypothetical protein